MKSCFIWFAALACRRDDLSVDSAAAGLFLSEIKSGNNSGDEDGFKDGRDKVLGRFFEVGLSWERDLAVCKI